MAITTSDVLSPAGELEHAALFPDESEVVFLSRVEGYIADAADRAADGGLTETEDADAFGFHWVHYRAYKAKYIQLNSKPASEEFIEGGSQSYLQAQLVHFAELLNEHLEAANSFLHGASTGGWGQAEVLRGS